MNFHANFAVICFVAVFTFTAMTEAKALNKSPTDDAKDIVVVKDIHEFIRNNPGMKLMRMTKQPQRLRDQSVQYSLGARVTGDRLVGQQSDQFSYPARKDVTIQLTYPEVGSGSVVTFVGLTCSQESDNGNAYVVAGGIGQRFISIVVEANQTENFAYKALYYGTD